MELPLVVLADMCYNGGAAMQKGWRRIWRTGMKDITGHTKITGVL